MGKRITLLSNITILLAFIFFNSCGLDPFGKDDKAKSGNLTGQVLTTDTNEGVARALVQISNADSLLAEGFTNRKGEFSFSNVDPGIIVVELRVPTGYNIVGEEEQTIEIDGNADIQFSAEPIRELTSTIEPGNKDTLATSSGAFIELDASTSDRALSVTIEEVETTNDEFESASKPVKISILQDGQPKRTDGSYGFKNTSSLNSLTLGVKIWQTLDDNNFDRTNFAYNVGAEGEPLFLYADTESTSYTDPSTGEEKTVALHSFKVSPDVDFLAILETALPEDKCSEYPNLRALEPVMGSQEGEKALILIHGWQPKGFTCKYFEEFNPQSMDKLGSLISKLQNIPEIESKYSFYTYRYPTNAPILAASNDLNDKIDEKIESGEFVKPVLLGHSMGGLVGRGLISSHGVDNIAGLITLGTPHKGSPLADVEWYQANFCSPEVTLITPTPCLLTGGLYLMTEGYKDLSHKSDFINLLNEAKGGDARIFALGSTINSSYDRNRKYSIGYKWLKTANIKSDGIVPIQSSTPEWAYIQKRFDNHDHEEIRESSSVVDQLIPILSDLSECTTPPERPDANDFKLSGSVGREDNRTVRVTLNAISVEGEIATDLTKNNFMMIENNCVKNIQDFSTENVGVDIVFIQDLSSSMDGAIRGVRSSVIDFANELAASGINTQFASVGYSGAGTIPSSPSTSSCEYLGPVQDLTNSSSFQNHVSSSWRAYRGCDGPENGLEAFEYAHNNLSWRTGAARVYIDITDVSHHTNDTSCNGNGNCTDQSLESIVNLLGETSIIHSVAPSNSFDRNLDDGLDPWLLSEATGGEKLILPSDGYVDLTELGISEVVGEAITFTFESFSPQEAIHSIRIRAEINGKIAELAPSLVRYKQISNELISSKD